MIDKVEYWLNLCDEDVLNAKAMLKGDRFLGAGFFCHQVSEKALKAVIASETGYTPPKIHDLRKLAEFGNIYELLSKEQVLLLEKLTPFQIEARYPEYKNAIAKTINAASGKQMLKETEEFLCWVKQRLGK